MCNKTLSLKKLKLIKKVNKKSKGTIKLPWFLQRSPVCPQNKSKPIDMAETAERRMGPLMPRPFRNHCAFRLTGLCYRRLTQSSQSEVLSTLVCAVSSLLPDLTQPLLSDAFFQPGNLSIFSPALPLSPLQFYAFWLNDTGQPLVLPLNASFEIQKHFLILLSLLFSVYHSIW